MARQHAVYNPETQSADLVPFTPEEEAEADAREALAAIPTNAMVNAERDRRKLGGFSFGGKPYNYGPDDRDRIAGATQMAFMAIVGGAQPGNLLWHGEVFPFSWIALDNSFTTMDAQTVVAFGRAAAAWEQAHIFAARALKDADPIPLNFADNQWWPA